MNENKSNKNGFSLLLFLVYLLFFSIISCSLCSITINLIIPTLTSYRTYQYYLQLYSCTDLFVHDVRSTSFKKLLHIDHNEIIWKTDDKDIGWYYHNSILERIEGIYDKSWKKKNCSVVATSLDGVYFKLDYKNNSLVGISMNLIPIYAKSNSIETYVAIRKQVKLYE